MDGMDSILTSIKKLLGIAEDYEQFDTDIIIDINSALAILTQLGVGPEEGFVVVSKTDTWYDFLGDTTRLEEVKTYIYLKVRLMFDPPTSSAAIDSMKNLISEMEWRINVEAESMRREAESQNGV